VKITSARQFYIRLKTENDVPAIEDVTSTAFINADHTNYNEQFIIRDLREANHLSNSLAAEDEITYTILSYAAASPINISTS
jgi:putative acetyltransferase